MKIYVDADACPVVDIVEHTARKYNVPVELLCDTNHVLHSSYSSVVVVGAGSDAVDFELVNRCGRGDIVVTQDYGVAAMALGRGSFPIHQSGMIYDSSNIDGLLVSRYMVKEARRRSAKNHIKGPKKRTPADDLRFEESLKKLIETLAFGKGYSSEADVNERNPKTDGYGG